MKTTKILLALFISLSLFTSCNKDEDPVIINEEELVTKVVVNLVPVSGGTTITLQSIDADGNGPNAPVYTVSSPLAQNTVYNASITLYNETTTPVKLLNEEIEAEASEHQFFYSVNNGLATFNYADFDTNNKPLGLDFTVTTSSTTGTGNLIITLRHEPNKSAEGVSNGDITNAGGETDLQVNFEIVVE